MKGASYQNCGIAGNRPINYILNYRLMENRPTKVCQNLGLWKLGIPEYIKV